MFPLEQNACGTDSGQEPGCEPEEGLLPIAIRPDHSPLNSASTLLRLIFSQGTDMAESRNPPTSINNPAVSTPAIHFLCRPKPMMAYTAMGPARVPKPTAVLSRPVLEARFSDPNISATTTGKREMKPVYGRVRMGTVVRCLTYQILERRQRRRRE